MFGKAFVRDLMVRSAETEADRRKFLKVAGATGFGVVGTSLLGGALIGSGAAGANGSSDDGPSDASILNFALNLEYLEAEFYHRAYYGRGLKSSLTDGVGGRGKVVGGSAVPFETKLAKQLAAEIALDELHHVEFLRYALAGSAVGEPDIDLQASFTAAAQAAGLIKKGQTFNPFADENSFLLAAFIFEDVGVTAYKGAAPLISNKDYLEAAAGILAVEAYHAASIRTILYERGYGDATKAISNARDRLDGPGDDDQGVIKGPDDALNITPTDMNSIAFSRSPGQVLNIVYLTPDVATKGGFFPEGVNGELHISA